MKRLAAFLLLISAAAFAQTYSDIALQNSSGNYARIVPFAPVTVCAASDTAVPCTNKVTTYTDQTLGTACTLTSPSTNFAPTSGTGCNNPGVADINGNYTVFLSPGTYRVCVYSGNYLCELKGTAGGSASGGTVQGTANQITASTVGTITTVALVNPTTFPGGALFNGAVSINSGIGAVGLIPDPLCAFSFGLGSQDQLCNLNGQLVWNFGGVTGSNFLIPWMKYYDLIGSPPANGSLIFFNSVTGQFELLNGNTSGTKALTEDAAGNASWGTAGATLQTNSVNNTSQNALNFQTSTANVVGLTVTPSNPSAGNEKLEITGSNYTGNAATATNVAYPGITAGSNTVAKTEGTGGSLAPLNIGQVAGSQVWIPNSLLPATGLTLTPATGSGSLPANHQIAFQIVFNSAAGTTWPSPITLVNTSNPCTGGCNVTVTAPTLPTGYTGYTTYNCDNTVTPGCTPLQQAASNNCVNITTNCVVLSLAAGSAVPTTNTAWVQPPNVQADECPPSVFPYIYGQTNDGNFHTWAGMDTNTANSNVGQLTFCRKVFFTDLANPSSTFQSLSEPISYNNAFIAMNHEAGVGTNVANQDRLLGMLMTTPTNDSATRKGIEGIQLELDKNCNGCSYTPGPDSEVSALSLQLQDNSATNTSSALGTYAARLTYFRAGNGWDSGGEGGINTQFSMNSNTGFNGIASGYRFRLLNESGTANSLSMIGYWDQFSPSITITNGQIGLYTASTGGAPTGNNNHVVRNDMPTVPTYLNGVTTVGGVNMNNIAALPVAASLSITPAVTVNQASATLGGPGVTCTGGASTYTYQLVGVDSNGGQFIGNQSNCTTGVNPLTVGNPATISINQALAGLSIAELAQFSRLDVYRVAGPMALGKVGSMTCNPGAYSANLCTSFVDSGLAATGSLPTVNTTGGIGAAGIIAGGNTVYVASDFTSAANTNLQTITGLTWNVSQAAQKHAFHCSLNYSQATAAAAMQFGIQVATVAPNSVDARGRIDTSATAVASGTLNGLNTTTATAIVTFTPSAAATVFGAELDGTLDLPQNNAGNQINIMVQTSNSADLPTVKKGSYCSILP